MADGTNIDNPSSSMSETDDDIWDDNALIQAYDKAVNVQKMKIEEQMRDTGLNGPSKPENPKTDKSVWKPGMKCRTIYSADGIEYEASIKSITDDVCTVIYLGYNNEEEVPTSSLKPSLGQKSIKNQIMEAGRSSVHLNQTKKMPIDKSFLPPPPPPKVMGHFPKDQDDAFSAMMMSWYMSGYHTGYYQALSKAKSCSCKGNCSTTQ